MYVCMYECLHTYILTRLTSSTQPKRGIALSSNSRLESFGWSRGPFRGLGFRGHEARAVDLAMAPFHGYCGVVNVGVSGFVFGPLRA